MQKLRGGTALSRPGSPLSKEGYLQALKAAIEEKGGPDLMLNWDRPSPIYVSFDTQCRIKECAEALGQLADKNAPFVCPFGTLKARIGLILDYGTVTMNDDLRTEHISQDVTMLPWGLKEAGFTECNSLVWTFNHQKYLSLDLSGQAKLPRPQETALLNNLTWDIIRASSLRVIIMWGPNAEKSLVTQNSLFGPLNVQFGKFHFVIYLELSPAEIHRVYIKSPGCVASLGNDKWRDAQKIGEVFKVRKVFDRHFRNSAICI
jgi:hypothetical protein